MIINFNSTFSGPNFQRKPSGAEIKRYTKTINEGLRVLDKNLGIIVHNSSVPSKAKQNLGIGSLLSKNAQLAFIPFLVSNGFSSIQQEPNNKRSEASPSPYSPQSNAKNIFMIPLERLATEEYSNLIPQEIIQDIINKNSERKSHNKVDYNQVAKNYEKTLLNAYMSLVNETDEHQLIGLPKNERLAHIKLKNEFDNFKFEHQKDLEPMAVFDLLTRKNNCENWKTWADEEKYLYSAENSKALKAFLKKNATEIDFYIFKQWLAEREISKANKRNQEIGIKVIGDSPVAWTPVEEWLNQDLFIENYALGCPPDYFAKDGQRWGFSVLKPETLFNPDGSLGKGGKLLQKRYEKMFEASPGGVRIDHIIGLIDPFVYSKNEPKMTKENSGRLYSSPNHPDLGNYAKNSVEEYASIIEKIVIPAAEKFGLTKDNIICEDLGTVTPPVRKVIKKLGLSGIAVTEFDHRGKKQSPNKTIMLGSHDNPSFIQYTKNLFKNKRALNAKATKLANDTVLEGQNVKEYKNEIKRSQNKFISVSFLELFTSPAKNIQIFFTDFFGIGKTYNKPGKQKDCWTLRIPEQNEKLYWQNVKKGTAPNLPETIATAIRHKGNDFAQRHKNLLANLDEFAQILKE